MGNLATVLVSAIILFNVSFINGDDIDDLKAWLESHGAFFEPDIASPCDGCPRGAIARLPYKEGDIMAAVPLNSTVDTGVHGFENGDALYEKLMLDPEFNATFGVFWKTQPTIDDVMCLETFTPEQLELLQSPELVSIIKDNQQVRQDNFYQAGGIRDRIRDKSGGKAKPSFAAYSWVCGLVTSRAFSFTSLTTEAESTFMIPAIDMINHSTQRVNVRRHQEGGVIQVIATRDIQAGEELLYEYDPGVVHRPDMSLLIYGFVARDDENQLSLAAIDLPDFNPDDPYGHTAREDDPSQVNKVKEARRVQERLREVEAQSTLEQDEALLAGLEGNPAVMVMEGWGWKELEIIRFRVRRKRALHAWLATLQGSAAEL